MTTDAEHDPALRMSDETSSAGRIWASVFVTLDGIMGDPEQWMPAVASEESNELVEHDVRSSDRMMFGATTFAELSAFWPSQPDSVPVAAITNQAAKTVVSSTLTEANWGPDTQIERDPVAAVQRLREAGQKVSVTGSASLVRQLLAAGELDELRLFQAPVLRGSGLRLFDTQQGGLDLTDCRQLPHGVLRLVYVSRQPS